MSNSLSRVIQRSSLRAGVRRALESGIGIYRTGWQIDTALADHSSDDLAAELIAWARQALSEMHRPYGLNHVTLALTVLNCQAAKVASANYGILRPEDFYGDQPLESQVHGTLHRWAGDDIITSGRGGRLSAVLFSWGDLTRELLLAG